MILRQQLRGHLLWVNANPWPCLQALRFLDQRKWWRSCGWRRPCPKRSMSCGSCYCAPPLQPDRVAFRRSYVR